TSCSPPYYFDDKGIQRLKAECMNGSGMIAGPYGAAVPARASAKSAAAAPAAVTSASGAPAGKSSSGNKPAGGSCNPPYYFEGNIRRLKLECL
ncbi:MAG TPA: hypothetical protein VNN80_12295, partial [Polyangiaceae bacterium]|nr:hypothetical protein [Polyangiaceae bacterium]